MPTGIGSGIAGEVFTDEIGSGSRGGSTICPTRYSVEFNGSSQWGSEEDTKIDLGTDNFSFSFWFKTIGGGTKQGFHTTRLGSGANGLDIYLSAAGQLTADFDTISFVGSTVPSDNEWHHAVLSVDRLGDWKWYLDGVNINTVDHSAVTAPIENGGTSAWARTTNSPVDYFDGNLTELSIWGTALSSSEVLTIYNNMFGSQTCLTDLTFSSGNLIQNGSFNQIGPQLIDNPTFNAPTSPDLIVNGDFTDTGADVIYNGDFADTSIALGSAGSGWGNIQGTAAYTTFGGDTAVKLTRATTTNSIRVTNLTGYNPILADTSYRLTYTVLENNGVTNFRIYASGEKVIPYSVATHIFYFRTGSVNNILDFRNYTNNSDITFTDVICEPLGEGWTIGGTQDATHYVEFIETGARFVLASTSPIIELKQTTFQLLANKSYKLTVDMTRVSGSLKIDGGGLSELFDATTSGTNNTRYITPTSNTYLQFYRQSTPTDITFHSVSVQEVDWAFGGGWSLGSNKALATAAAGGDTLYQTGVFTLDKSYKTTFLSTLDSGNCFAEFGSDGFIGQLPPGTASNLFYYQTNEVGDSARIAFEAQSLMTGSISNVLTYQMDPNGYWNIPTANSTQLVLNPTFTNTGPEEVTNGDFSQTALGITLVTDGEFPSGTTAWTLRGTSALNVGSATVEGLGALSLTSVNRGISQPVTILAGTSYKITFTAKQLTGSGVMYAGLGYAQPFDQVITSDYEVYTFDQVPANVAGSWPWICFGGAVGNTFEIKDVSVKEVLQEISNGDFTDTGTDLVVDGDFPSGTTAWSLFNATLESGGVRINNNGTTDNAYITQGILGSPSGKSFVLTYDVISTNGTLLVLEQLTEIALDTTTPGIDKKLYFTWDKINDTLAIKRKPANIVDITIDNVRFEELGADWTVTMSDGSATTSLKYVEFVEAGARFVSDVAAAPYLYLDQSTLSSGKLYKFTCNVAYTDVGGIKVSVGASGFITLVEGLNTIYSSAPTTSTLLRFIRASDDVDCIISNVSVQELGEGWSVSAVGGFSFNGSGLSLNSSAIDTSGGGGGTVFSACQQVGSIFDVGKSYKLVIEDLDITSGSIELKFGLNHATVITRPILTSADNGTYVYYLVAEVDSDSFTISSATGTVATLGSISVKETGLDWISPDAGTVNTFNATGLTMTSVNGGTNNNRIRQVGVTADDQAYKVDYTIEGSSLTAGNYLQFYTGVTYIDMKTTVGPHTLHFTRSGTNDDVYLRLKSTGSTTDTVDIGSITIVEVQGWTLEDGKLVGDLPDLAKSATQDIGAIAGNSYKATMDVALAEEELITNGSFREVGADLVLEGDFPKPSVHWLKAASTTINGGSATFGGLGTVADMLAGAFALRVEADGGVVEAQSCLISDLTFLTENP